MLARCARLLAGFVVLAVSVCSILWVVIKCTHIVQKQAVTRPNRSSVPLIDPNLAKDPSIDGAKIKAIGPLATAMKDQDEATAVPNGESANLDSGQDTAVAPQVPPSPFDLVGHDDQAPRHFHASFRVSRYRYFRLVVPAHSTSPRLHGSFTSSAAGRRAEKADFLVFEADQFNNYVRLGDGAAVFSDESSNGIIDVLLKPTIFDARQYFLVFSSPDNQNRTVTADLTATFD